jgi:hypothetical protein
VVSLLLLVCPAHAGWTVDKIFDPPSTTVIVRNLGVTVDPSTSPTTKFFVSDAYETTTMIEKLFYKYATNGLSSRVILSEALTGTNGKAYLPSLATVAGDSLLWVLSRYTGATNVLVQELEVTRSTGAATTDTTVADDATTVDSKHSFLALDDADTRHAC